MMKISRYIFATAFAILACSFAQKTSIVECSKLSDLGEDDNATPVFVPGQIFLNRASTCQLQHILFIILKILYKNVFLDYVELGWEMRRKDKESDYHYNLQKLTLYW